MPVRELYERTLAERGYGADAAQLRAVDSLERCENEWADYKPQNWTTAGWRWPGRQNNI